MAYPTTAGPERNRVWIVSELYYPEETSTGGELTRLAEGLAPFHFVSVLCAQPTYNARGQRAPAQETRANVAIRRCWSTTLDSQVLLFRLVNMVTIGCSIFYLTLRHVRPNDIVLVVTNPPILPFVVSLACWLRSTKLVLLIHDMYPEVLIRTGKCAPTGIVVCLFNWLNRLCYRSVERIVVLGRDMESVVRAKLGPAHQEKIIHIPNCNHDPETVVPENRSSNALLKRLNLTDKFVVQYSGNMGRTHGLECLLQAAELMDGANNVHFLFIGSGAKKMWLQEAVAKQRLGNVTILPYLPRADLPNSLNACDVAIISFIPDMAGVSVPSRMYNVMAAGKPIIAVADATSEIALVVRDEQVGWVVAPGRPEKLVEALLQAQADPERVSAMGKRCRALVEGQYSLGRIFGLYNLMIESLHAA